MNRRAFLRGVAALPIGCALGITATQSATKLSWTGRMTVANLSGKSLSGLVTATLHARGEELANDIVAHNALLRRLDV